MSKFLQYLEQDEIFFSSRPWFFTILMIFLVVLLKRFFNPWTSTAKLVLPPSPLTFPIIGNFHNIGLQPHRSLRDLAQRLGPLMLLRLGSVPVVVVSSSVAAREIMKTHDLAFANRPKSTTAQKLLYDSKDVAFSPYSEYWRQIKSSCVLHLLSNKRVQSFRLVREEETALLIDKIRKSGSLPVNLSEIFATLTNNIICRVCLGRKYSEGESGKKFKELLSEFGELLGGFNVGDYFQWLAWVSRINGLEAKMERVAKAFDAFLEQVLEEHMARYERRLEHQDQKDFVDVLLEMQRENTVGFPIERVSVKALILDMFAAGTDTTYTVLEWAMTELLRHPEIMKELQKQVKNVAGGKSDISEDDLDEMHYLKAVIKETLRLHPPVPLLVPRISTQDVKIKGYDIPRGTQVIINAWAIGRDSMSWDKPEEFLPERFLNNPIDFKGHHFELIPFGSGRRMCPGILFAMKINELFLANLVHKFDWSLPGGASEKDLDTSESFGITIHRKSPLMAIANPCFY